MRLIDADALAEKKFQERECNGLGEGPAYRQGWNDAIDAVMDNEPSAQPETHDKRTESHACDLIDRAEAIDALRTHERKPSKKWFDNQLDIEWNNAIDICCYDIEDLPSAQPERKRGKWKPYRCDMYECSECGYIYTELTDRHRCGANYCPNCGADMREDEQE